MAGASQGLATPQGVVVDGQGRLYVGRPASGAPAPRTMSEKVVYVADRRGGMTIESVEERAKETAARHPKFTDEIARSIPIAKQIEREVFAGLPFRLTDLAAHVDIPLKR